MHKRLAAKQYLCWCRLCYPSANTLRRVIRGWSQGVLGDWMPRTLFFAPNPFSSRIRGAIDDVVVKVARQDPSCCAIHCTIEHINQASRSKSNESGEQMETERTTPSKTTQHGIARKASTTASFYPTCCPSITPNRSKDHRMVVATALASTEELTSSFTSSADPMAGSGMPRR